MKQFEGQGYSFEYLTAKAQEGFQQNISGLLEVQQHLTERIKKAKAFRWKGVMFSITESELTSKYLLTAIGELMGHQESLNKCIVHLNRQQRITEAIIEVQAKGSAGKSLSAHSNEKA